MTQQIEIKIAGQDEYPSYLRMLVVGPPGCGKTTLGSQFPNPLFVTAGGDLTTLARLGSVPYVQIRSLEDLFTVKKLLDLPQEDREAAFGFPVESLVIDTVDNLQRVLLWEHVRNDGRTDTTAGDWGWIAERFHRIFSGLRQLDMHLLVLAHPKDVHYGDDRAVIQPALGGAFATDIHDYVHVSTYMNAGDVEDLEAYLARLTGVDVTEAETWTTEIQITTEQGLKMRRTLRTTPLPHVPWATDHTGTLPKIVEVTDTTFSNIWDRISPVQLEESVARIVEVPQEEQAPEPDATEVVDDRDAVPVYTCEQCGDTYTEKTWNDLSKLKYGKVLCATCYKK